MTKPQSRGAAAAKASPVTANAAKATPPRSKSRPPTIAESASRATLAKVRKSTVTPLKQGVTKPTPLTAAPPQGSIAPAPNASNTAPADMTARAFREDPELDRHIIEGMLQDKDAFLGSMQKQGYAREAVLRRAAELGLSEALIRQVMGVAADLAGERPGRRRAPASLGARKCLQCDRVFLSSGPGNRLCMRCRGGDAGLAQL